VRVRRKERGWRIPETGRVWSGSVDQEMPRVGARGRRHLANGEEKKKKKKKGPWIVTGEM